METTQPQPQTQPKTPVINFPRVSPESVTGFAKAWDMNGIKIMLDRVTVQFATDFANQALRSYHLDLINKAMKVKAAKEAAAAQANDVAPAQANPAPVPPSSIILTDAS